MGHLQVVIRISDQLYMSSGGGEVGSRSDYIGGCHGPELLTGGIPSCYSTLYMKGISLL